MYGSRTRGVAFLVLLCLGLGAAIAAESRAQGFVLLANPNWEIIVDDYGYSDLLLDNTPGFEGREYLSGEWAGAIRYDGIQARQGIAEAVMWIPPFFLFPDWETNSTFLIESPMAITGSNADGLPIAESTLSNGDVRIQIRLEMIDTLFGVTMGNTPVSALGPRASVASNRYVLLQRYTFTNISGITLANAELFQFLHGLNSFRALYDDTAYAGLELSEYRYDSTQRALDFAAGESPFEDLITLHARVAPIAFDSGAFGVESVDDHSTGKPSVGTHLHVEANTLNGLDDFEPDELWVGSAQKHSLGTLGPNASSTLEVLLSILTGLSVPSGIDVVAFGNGGSDNPDGGVAFVFSSVAAPGSLYVSFSSDPSEFEDLLGQLPLPPVELSELRFFWDIDFTGEFAEAEVTLHFPRSADAMAASVFHLSGGTWETLTPIARDPVQNSVTVVLDDFSPVIATPEPTASLQALGALAALLLVSRRRRRARAWSPGWARRRTSPPALRARAPSAGGAEPRVPPARSSA